jgi:hypothetical protein
MKQIYIGLAALAALFVVALITPTNAAAQCCEKVCTGPHTSTRCGHIVHGTPLGCSNCTPPFTGPSDGLDQGCIEVGPAPENDPSKAGICVGGTVLSQAKSSLVVGCVCVGEFGCFDGVTASAISNTTCRSESVANCGPNKVVNPADPDCP